MVIHDTAGGGDIQQLHSKEDSELVSNHLKRTLEGLIRHLFFYDEELNVLYVIVPGYTGSTAQRTRPDKSRRIHQHHPHILHHGHT